MLYSMNGRTRSSIEARFDAEPDVEVVDAVDPEAVALDARDRRPLLPLVVGDDVRGVVERVGQVEAEAERRVLLGASQVGRGDAAELRARPVPGEADGARPVDEPELGRATDVEHAPEMAEGLESEVGVAEHLEERGLVGGVGVRVRARPHVLSSYFVEPHRERDVALDVVLSDRS